MRQETVLAILKRQPEVSRAERERLRALQIPEVYDDWPEFFIVTGGGTYRWSGPCFERVARPSDAQPIALPSAVAGHAIVDVRTDEESTFILLDSRSMIVFWLAPHLLGNQPFSLPEVEFVTVEQAERWSEELASSKPL